MLTQVDIVQGDGTDTVVKSLPVLGATPKTSLLVRKITGLDAPDATLFIGEYSRDGGTYTGRRVGRRNPVFTLELNPNPANGETIDGLRKEIYKAFMDPLVDADHVKINLIDDLNNVQYLVGYTEKIETDIFSTDQFVQVSMICPDPYLRDNAETVHTADPGWTSFPYTYTGTAEAGFTATIVITTETDILTLENNGRKMVLTHPTGTFGVDDIITINTRPGEYSITLDDGALPEYSILSYLDPNAPWLALHAQDNTMKVYGTIETDYIAAVIDLRYTQTYWGI